MTEGAITAWPRGKVGFVSVVGRPNVGKSTFLNAVVRHHLSAVSPIPQTTRRHTLGIVSEEHSQIVFVDTPGIHEGRTELARVMLKTVRRSVVDADLVLCMVDPSRACGQEDHLAAITIESGAKDVVLALNKSDITTAEARRDATEFYRQRMKRIVEVFDIVALEPSTVRSLIDCIRERLPVGPFLFPRDQLTDTVEREIAAELIREAIYHHVYDELPHAVAVEIMSWREQPKKIRIAADIHVDRSSHKPMLIGQKGKMLEQIRAEAVSRLREWYDQMIDLKLFVKVSPDWRNNRSFLRDLGIESR